MKRKKISKILLFFFLIVLIVDILIVFSPMMLPANSVNNLDGRIMEIDHDFSDMPFPINLLYLSGDYICHQKEARSFVLNDNQMSLCSRCVAIIVGLGIGIGVALFYTTKPDAGFLVLWFISLIPIGIDGVVQGLGLWESTNPVRLVTGILPGIMSGFSIGVIYDEYLLWKNKKKKKNFKKEDLD